MGKKSTTSARGVRVPKVKCCESSERCGRCPIRLLAEGNLPDGYAVKKRKLVRCAPQGTTAVLKASGKIRKPELEKAVKRTKKNRRTAAAA